LCAENSAQSQRLAQRISAFHMRDREWTAMQNVSFLNSKLKQEKKKSKSFSMLFLF
jgi:hypothetical protein